MDQAIGQNARVVAERLRGAEDHRAVATMFDRRRQIAETHVSPGAIAARHRLGQAVNRESGSGRES
jgi:hypothetical protein